MSRGGDRYSRESIAAAITGPMLPILRCCWWLNFESFDGRGALIGLPSLWQFKHTAGCGRLLSSTLELEGVEVWQLVHCSFNCKCTLCENGAAWTAWQSNRAAATA